MYDYKVGLWHHGMVQVVEDRSPASETEESNLEIYFTNLQQTLTSPKYFYT